MIAPKESRNLKKSLKRTMWFIIGIFIFCLIECYLLDYYAKIPAVWNGFIIIVTAAVFYLLFLLICAKIDKKKASEEVENKTKDPFSH